MRICARCGAVNDDDAKFCSGCGSQFEIPPAAGNAQESETASSGQQYNGAGQQYNEFGQQYGYTGSQTAWADRSDGIPESKYKGYSIASMILGICSIVFCSIIPILPLAAAIVGLVLGKKAELYGDNGMAKAGRITSLIGIILIAVMFVLLIIGVILLSASLIEHSGDLDLSDYYNYFRFYY